MLNTIDNLTLVMNEKGKLPINNQATKMFGIKLYGNDVSIIQSCIENYNIDCNRGITGRNQSILEGFGCDFY